ncbi:MAG: DUF4019 domain-containing protein [Verrucomicrobiota bacterium]|nr:DUF4019 domain-containing protein [Verrucomicrobiota bacterium]
MFITLRPLKVLVIVGSLFVIGIRGASADDGAAMMKNAATLEQAGKLQQAAELYGKAAEAFEAEQKQSERTDALEKSAEMYEKYAEQLMGGSSPAKPAVTAAAAPAATAAPAQSEDQAKLKAAVRVISLWLKLLDDGKYGEAFDASAASFKQGLTREQWESTMQKERAPLGQPSKRYLKSANQEDNQPGAPIKFTLDCEFGGKPLSEIVNAEREADGQWRVSDYSIATGNVP